MKRALLLVVLIFGSAGRVAAQDSPPTSRGNRPVGTWEQTVGDTKITLTIAADRLHITATMGKDNKQMWLMDADYSVTKDSILYGIVTSTEGEKKTVATVPPGSRPVPPASLNPRFTPPPAISAPYAPPSEIPAAPDIPPLRLSVDDLFSFRFRVDDDILTIKETKPKAAGGRSEFVLQGRFKKNPKVGNGGFQEKIKDKPSDKRETNKEETKDNGVRPSPLPQSSRPGSRVHLLLLPSEEPNRVLDVDELRKKLPKAALYVGCDRLKALPPSQGKTTLMLEAHGRIQIQTSQFTAQAEDCEYNKAKDRLILRGSVEVPATLRKSAIGGEAEIIRGWKIIYDCRRGEVLLNGQDYLENFAP